jgi:signal transduction histidine kinase
MPALGTVLVTWCAFDAFAALYYAMLWVRARRRSPEHLGFGCVCLAFAIHAAGGALLVAAPDPRSATTALRLQYAGGLALVACGIDFASRLTGTPGRRAVLGIYAGAAALFLLDVGGLILDPGLPASEGPRAAAAADAGNEPAITILGRAALTLALLTAMATGIALLARNGRDRDVRTILLGGAVSVLAAVHDTAARVGALRPCHLLEHAGPITIVIVGYVVLRRYAAAAAELERRTAELARSYDELRHTQEELVRKEQLAAVGELSAVIAHEVRNPLAVLKNAVSNLRRPTLTPADRSILLRILDEETARLNRLVRDLLAYARPMAPKAAPVPIAPLVKRAIELARSARDGAPDVEIELTIAPPPEALLGDGELLQHALVHVIDNALQAMPSGGRLTIESKRVEHEGRPAVALAFRDTGEGMDTLVCAKALEPFFTTRAAGTGLGLAIVDRVVKNHGGTVDIASVPGGGTTVTLTLAAAE